MKKVIRILKYVLKKILFVTACIFCIIGAIFALTNIMGYTNDNKYQEDIMEEIRCQVIEDYNTYKDSGELETEETKRILPKYKGLYELNDDLYGWIEIQGIDAQISEGYPVMFTPDDPNFYEHKNFKKEESRAGSIWIDGRTTDESENIILYGHHMKNRTMFGSLKDYEKVDFYADHKYINFDTIYGEGLYEIISVSKGKVYFTDKGEIPPEDEYLFYDHVELNTKEEFNDYINFIKENAYYETGATAEYGDQLITLSTCEYGTKNERLLVVAKKIETY